MTAAQQDTPARIRRILFATDLSASAEHAGEYAIAFAKDLGATVEIAHVLPPPIDDWARLAWSAKKAEVMLRLRMKASTLRMQGIDAHAHVSSECPVPLALELLQKRLGTDLVVVGTESKGALDRLLLGSTAEALIRECDVPVLTVGPKVGSSQHTGSLFSKVVLATDFSETSSKAEILALQLAKQFGARVYVCHVPRRAGEQTKETWTS